MTEKMSIQESTEIANNIIRRQKQFGETLYQSIMVALLNAGDKFTMVACLNGEWQGKKGDIPVTTGIPVCPNGHVLVEAMAGRKALGWVDA